MVLVRGKILVFDLLASLSPISFLEIPSVTVPIVGTPYYNLPPSYWGISCNSLLVWMECCFYRVLAVSVDVFLFPKRSFRVFCIHDNSEIFSLLPCCMPIVFVLRSSQICLIFLLGQFLSVNHAISLLVAVIYLYIRYWHISIKFWVLCYAQVLYSSLVNYFPNGIVFISPDNSIQLVSATNNYNLYVLSCFDDD